VDHYTVSVTVNHLQHQTHITLKTTVTRARPHLATPQRSQQGSSADHTMWHLPRTATMLS
jgi:hypothetical protein